MDNSLFETKPKKQWLYWAFIGIPIGGNIIVVTFINKVLSKVFYGINLFHLLGIPDKMVLIFNIVPFLFATTLTMYYVWPVFFHSRREEKEYNLIFLRKLSNAGITIGLISFLAWTIPIMQVSGVLIIAQKPVDWFYFSSFCVINVGTGAMSFMLVYYGVDYIISKHYLRKTRKSVQLTALPKLYHVSIRTKFIIFLISVSLTPITIVSFALFIAHRRLLENGLDGDTALPLILLTVFSLASIFLTLLISKDFHDPLSKLGDAARAISAGNLDVALDVYKTDELGKITDQFNRMTDSLKEKEFIKDTLGKVVDPSVRDYMLGGKLNLGGEIKTATVLFSDIRSFTTLSENLNPEEVVHLLNGYFERMSHCIKEHSGIVNKYIGDAVMAIFGAPVEMEDHAQKAFEAGLAMIRAREAFNKELAVKELPPLKTGIGIHCGELLSGNIGSKDRLEYTVIGDTVNVSSRIESLCKKLKSDFLISDEIYDQLTRESRELCTYKGKVQVKGKKNYIKIYEVMI